ncbi:hypothetical protein Tco_0349793 [Tanacetum coccineum]
MITKNNKSRKGFQESSSKQLLNLFLLVAQEKLNHLPKTTRLVFNTAVNMWIEIWCSESCGGLQLGIEKLSNKVNKGMETRNGQRMTRRRSKDFITLSRKDYRTEGSNSKSGKLCGEESNYLVFHTLVETKSHIRVLRIILVILPEHPSETIVFHNEDGNPARANIKQALGYRKDGDGDGKS